MLLFADVQNYIKRPFDYVHYIKTTVFVFRDRCLLSTLFPPTTPLKDSSIYIGDLNHDNIKTWFGFRSFRILSHENKQQIIFQIMIWVCRVPIPMLLLCSASHLLATPLSCFVCYPLVLWFYIANKKIDHYIWYHHPTEIVVVSRWIMAL